MHVFVAVAADGNSVSVIAGSQKDQTLLASVYVRDNAITLDLVGEKATVSAEKLVEAIALAGEILL